MLQRDVKVGVQCGEFVPKASYYDVVLTSPPYGDSKTTVAYGQFSLFANEWLGINYARKIDKIAMGGKIRKELFKDSLISEQIDRIYQNSPKRAYEVSSFYYDLDLSIRNVAKSIRKGGYAIYVVGNRTVKDETLLTDQFIAERFELYGFKHVVTYERNISNKSMPLKNSPTNKTGVKRNTMKSEYIVVCEKVR